MQLSAERACVLLEEDPAVDLQGHEGVPEDCLGGWVGGWV